MMNKSEALHSSSFIIHKSLCAFVSAVAKLPCGEIDFDSASGCQPAVGRGILKLPVSFSEGRISLDVC
jgi:hypothetical protein